MKNTDSSAYSKSTQGASAEKEKPSRPTSSKTSSPPTPNNSSETPNTSDTPSSSKEKNSKTTPGKSPDPVRPLSVARPSVVIIINQKLRPARGLVNSQLS